MNDHLYYKTIIRNQETIIRNQERTIKMFQEFLDLLTRLDQAFTIIAANAITPADAEQLRAGLAAIVDRAESLASGGTPPPQFSGRVQPRR